MTRQDSTDILILGAGPAGLAAALAAANSGLAIVLVDDNILPGGQIWRTRSGQPSPASAYLAQLAHFPNVRIRRATRCVLVESDHQVLLENQKGAWKQSFQRLIVCSGARELLLPFPGWTLPGVTGAGGLQALIKSGVQVKSQRIVIAGSGPLLLAAARSARQAGANVVRVAEQSSASVLLRTANGLWRWPSKLWQATTLATRAYRPSSWVMEALGTHKVEAVRMSEGGTTREVACDRIACGHGLVPNTETAQALGMALTDTHAIAVNGKQQSSVLHCYAAGECTGIGGSEKALVEGEIAGFAATGRLDLALQLADKRAHWRAFAAHLQHHLKLDTSIVKSLIRSDTLVCRCEDVPASELDGCTGWIDAKLRTRCGMGPCQGRVCGTAAVRLWGWQAPQVRQHVAPFRIGSLCNDLPTSTSDEGVTEHR